MPLPLAADIGSACARVLNTADPRAKAMTARAMARGWRLGRLAHRFDVAMPDRPARPDAPALLPPSQMPRRGKGGSLRGRIAMLHALAHIEFGAIDLAFDLVGRFGAQFPPAFVNDWMRVGADEAMHFALIDRRLQALGSHYGAHPAHDGLWQAAEETAGDAMARLAVVPMVLEARGLDVTPAMIAQMESIGDAPSARILHRIMTDEIRHVAAGTTWFRWAAEQAGQDSVALYQTLVRRHFRGPVKPPFNDSARRQAGLTRDYYAALAT